jgi:four helix bundle protein
MKDEAEENTGKNTKKLIPLRVRTTQFALGIVRMYVGLPKTQVARTMGLQVFRSGTSVGSQYREAFRARSNAESISKLESVLQELDETDYWLELLGAAGAAKPDLLAPLRKEANELMAILVTAVKNIKSRTT